MKKAILTIDDVPSNNTKAIVDYLNEKDITVVMFAVGEQLEKSRRMPFMRFSTV